MKRPSHRELDGKLKAASDAAGSGRIRLVEPLPIVADLLDLGVLVEDLPEIIAKMLSEIGARHYRGARPPVVSYEKVIVGCELYAFRWVSKELGCMMYFKFALKDRSLWICSLHEDRSNGREGA